MGLALTTSAFKDYVAKILEAEIIIGAEEKRFRPVSITNIVGKIIASELCGDTYADMSLVGLLGHDADLEVFSRFWKTTLKERAEAGCSLPEALLSFTSNRVWRRDGQTWLSSRILASDTAGNVAVVVVRGREGRIRFFSQIGDGEVSLMLDEGSSEPLEVDEQLALSFSKAVRNASGEFSSKSYIRLWNGRIYDSLEMMAKIRQLYNTGIIQYDGLVVTEREPLLSDLDAMGDCGDKIIHSDIANEIDKIAVPYLNYIKTIQYNPSRWNAFIPEMKLIASSMRDDSFGKRADGVVFISFDLEKRQLINQVELFKDAISILKERFGTIGVLINGMTGPDGGAKGEKFYADIHAAEKILAEKIFSEHNDVDVVDMFGWSLNQKIKAVSTADFYLAPTGNASFIPMSLDVPGVCFASPKAMDSLIAFSSISPRSIFVDRRYISSSEVDLAIRKVAFGQDDGTRISYSIDSAGFRATILNALRDGSVMSSQRYLSKKLSVFVKEVVRLFVKRRL